jgi:hypothetical protein
MAEFLSGIPTVVKVLLPLLVILMIGGLVRRLLKFAVLVGLLILFVLFVYPLFDF